MPIPDVTSSVTGMKAMPFHADGDEVAAATKAKVATISCDGHIVPIGPEGQKAFAKILAKAQSVGTYEGKPLDSSGHNVNSYIDSLRVQGLSDQKAVELANSKFGVNVRPNAA